MIGIVEVRNTLNLICNEIIQEKEVFTEIDSKLGDGDMGISLEKGAIALKQVLEEKKEKNISDLFLSCATAFNRAAPSTLGTLLSFSMISLAKETKGLEVLEESKVASFPKVIAQAIAEKGKAKLGDKTILDALLPYANMLWQVYCETNDMGEALEKALFAAEQGMEKTKGMLARTGRASWLDGRNREYPDGGAVLCVKVAQRLCKARKKA